MRTEVPVFKRCCFCLPLRRGVLTWAYIKIIFLILSLLSDGFNFKAQWLFARRSDDYWFILRIIIIFLTKAMTLGCSIFLLVAGHMKSSRLLRISYICELVSVISIFVIFVAITIFDLITMAWFIIYFFRYMFLIYLIQIIYICVQLYVIALIRSEMLKLESAHEFRFVNNAAAAECYYECEGEGATNTHRDHDHTGATDSHSDHDHEGATNIPLDQREQSALVEVGEEKEERNVDTD